MCVESVQSLPILLLFLSEVIDFGRNVDLWRAASIWFFYGIVVVFFITNVLELMENPVYLWTTLMQQQGSFLLVVSNSHSNDEAFELP